MPSSSRSARTRTFSALEKLRGRVARAEARLKACQTRYDDLRARVKAENPTWATDPERAVWSARLELNDAEANLVALRQSLAAEEKRLLQPGAFLRFT